MNDYTSRISFTISVCMVNGEIRKFLHEYEKSPRDSKYFAYDWYGDFEDALFKEDEDFKIIAYEERHSYEEFMKDEYFPVDFKERLIEEKIKREKENDEFFDELFKEMGWDELLEELNES